MGFTVGYIQIMTQAQLAKQLGWSQAMLSYVINGKKRPSWARAKQLADVLGMDPQRVMDLDIKAIQTAILHLRGSAES